MKKIIFLLIISSMIAGTIQSQVKVDFSVSNARFENNLYTLDVIATVPAEQTWKVGPTCIRVGFQTLPDSFALSVHPDNPATNANINLSGNSDYSAMTTTSIMEGKAVSLNIFNFQGRPSYELTEGSYTLGAIRWNVEHWGSNCIDPTILQNSAIFNELVGQVYNTGWSLTDTTCIPISVKKLSEVVPVEYNLYQNYPNPFNPSTTIKFDIARTTDVQVVIYDALGRQVESLVNERLATGTYEVKWNAGNYSSGIYFYSIITKEYTRTNKMILMK
ncbi:MAG: T9SS C-terminal target domain-containing protein [Ignavibacteriae bacterium]|nr:MAG: T9SS C-terminal target domain-containing protein [Ignavibacteriota bacterium]